MVVNGAVQSVATENRLEPLLRREMPELDAVRGMAILGVVLYHGLYWSIDLSQFSRIERVVLTVMWLGRLGVNLFFVLSGFLITRLLLEARSNPHYYSRFYLRRALRILPAYCVTIVILLATHYAPLTFIALSAVYLSNLTPIFHIAIAYPVLWSLAVEEHFYFLWPFAVRRWTNNILLALALCTIILSPVSRLISFYLTKSNGLVSYVCNDYTWNSLDGLACGATLAVFLVEFRPSRLLLQKMLALMLGIASVIWAIGVPFGILTRQKPLGAALQVTPWHFVFVAFIGCCLLVGSSTHKRFVQIKPLRLLGEVSYGLYLYHLLIFELFDKFLRSRIPITNPFSALLSRCFLVSCLALLMAFISRRFFEGYFLKLKERLAP